MPSRTWASCWRDPGFRGAYFSTLDPELAAMVAAADGLAPGLLSPVLDSRSQGYNFLHNILHNFA